MEKPFIQRPIAQPYSKFTQPTDTKYKYLNKVNLPERKIDENLVSKLFLLVDEGNISKIKDFILQNAFLLNVKNDINKESVLHTVIKSENISNEDKTYLVKFFLFKGVSAVSFDKFNVTPIHLAVKNQLKDVVDLLIKYGADPNSLDSNNMNTLHYAVIGKNIKCPVKVEETQFIIPKKGIIKTEEQLILQDLFNNINNLYFMDTTTQNIFKNIYNNINNYNVLYDDIISQKKIELENTVAKILRKEDTNIEKKSELIKDELDKISNELKGSFMKELDNNVIDFSKIFNYDTTNNKITFNDNSLDLEKLNNALFNNLLKSLTEIDNEINKLINSVDDTNKNIYKIKKELVNIKWLNRTLVINYVWDNNSGANNIAFNNASDILFNNTYPNNANIPVDEEELDEIYKLDDNKKIIRNYNLILNDSSTINITTEPNYNNFDLDIDNDNIYSDSASKYKRATLEEEEKEKKEKEKEKTENKNKTQAIEKNVLGYDIVARVSTSNNKLGDGINTYSFPYSFSVDGVDPVYTLSDDVKRTFLKPVHVLSDLLNKQIHIIKTNFGVINEYIKHSEGWNIMIHIVPSIIISIFNSIKLLKSIDDELKIINQKLPQIRQLFIDKQNENKSLSNTRFGHYWIYEKAIIAVDTCNEELNHIQTNTQYNLILNIIQKYNVIIDKIRDLQGFKHIREYHSNFKLDDINNISNTDTEFLKNTYTLNTRIFSNNFDTYKLNFDKYKQLNSIDNTRQFFETNYLNKLFNETKNNFYNDSTRKDDIDNYLRINFNYKYPDDTNKQAFRRDESFMTINPYTDPNIYHIYHFNNINFQSNFNDPRNQKTKDQVNNSTIVNTIGNHYILQKHSLIHYISNIFIENPALYPTFTMHIKSINNGELYKNIKKNLKEYKNQYRKIMKISEEDFQYTHYKLLVDVLAETFDNYIEFLIKQKSKQLAYELFESYKIKDINNNFIKFNSKDNNIDFNQINSIDYFPIIKNDKQFRNLGISTKLTIDEIENLEASEYYDYIDNDLIKKTKSIEYYKTDSNTCYQINQDIIKTLIDNKANLSQKDNSGRIPIMYALEFKNLRLIGPLSKANGIKFYKNNQDVINYFNTLIKSTINELVNEGSYNEFYEKYEKKLIKKLESKTEINTNILASVEYTIPMYLSLLNSLLFNVLLNYKYKYTQDDLNKLLKLFRPVDKNLYYGPILYKINSQIDLKDQSKINSKSVLDKEIKKIEDKIKFDESAKLESENEIKDIITQNDLFETVRHEQLNLIITDLSKSIIDFKAKENLLQKLNITQNLKKLDKSKIKFSNKSIKNVSSMYNNIFKNILNDITVNGYRSTSFDLKRYKTLWKDYITEKQDSKYISNIHLVSMNFIDNNLTQNKLNKNLDIFNKLFEVFNQVSKDYSESPLEFNMTNSHLEESLKLIIHTLTHTVINYLYFTITKMLIKQLEETYDNKMYASKKEYQEYIINLLQQILDNRGSSSELITYLFEDMPEKLVKCTLNIYDTDADPDYKKPIDSIFSEIIKIIKTSSLNIINTGDDSELIKNLTAYVIPYYKEYTTIIINELYDLTKNFFKHLEGMHDLIQIYTNLN
jgi:hypothetical protein